MVDGFYALFFTGTMGNGLALIVLKDGAIAGTDMAGSLYDGKYAVDENRAIIEGEMILTTPLGIALLTGAPGQPVSSTQRFPFSLPTGLNEQVSQVQISSGPVNVRFKKIRDFPVARC